MQIDWPYEFPGAYWLDDKEESAVQDVLQNGSLFRYYGLGTPQYVDAFENASRRYFGKRYALAVNSGTGALMTAMSALGIGPGCEVILPSFLWVATVSSIVQLNAIPVLCEVDETLCMDPEDLARKISIRTRLIVPIHMIGSPCNMEAIMSIAARHRIPVLEDTAQCIGGSYHGRPLGSFGQIGIFSLQLNKNITCGEGGLLVTDDERLYQRAFAAHDMGMIRVNGRLAQPGPDAIAWGAGRRMGELCGAVASVQMEKLGAIISSMRGSKQRIQAALADVPGLDFGATNDSLGESGAFLTLRFDSAAKAATVTRQMREAGLHNVQHLAEYGLHIYHRIPALVDKVPVSPAGNPWNLPANAQSVHSYERGTCPRSDAIFARTVLLPIPSRLTEAQETAAADAIRKATTTKEIPSPHYRSTLATRS
jgi:dTDP-4-amino-4,6-dideoxygalactose transaminase